MPQRRKQRLDILLVERGLVDSRSLAQRLILAGRVTVDGQEALHPGKLLPPDSSVELTETPRYVSRGGEKLEAALQRFSINPKGRICADVGASTGGFTDCLLQHGAARVYAIDVGKGILDWKLRNDPRVVVMEEQNARFLESLPEPADLVTADVAFISLRLLFPVFRAWLRENGEAVVLIKPQFEAGRGQVGRGGVVRDPDVHRRVLEEVLASAEGNGFAAAGLMPSPLKGPAGNIEFLALLTIGGQAEDGNEAARVEDLIQATLKSDTK
jgi:23S rRNA (cytidine1920-2'-O)/16S rRNA (cytidine1409-2'-O)-methyltransferase